MTGSPMVSDVVAVKKEVKKGVLSKKKVAVKVKKPVTKKIQKKKVKKNKKFSVRKNKIVSGGELFLPELSGNVPISMNDFSKLSVVKNSQIKKAIRRSALEVKEAEEVEENKKSDQEREWEIPAFLRLKK